MNHDLTRRDFLRRSAATSLLAAAGLGLPGGVALGQTPIRRRPAARLKTSLNAYSFNDALLPTKDGKPPAMSLFDALEFCADNDFDAIDATGYYFPGYPQAPSEEYLAKFKRRAFELGVEISGTGIRNNFASSNKAARAADVKLAKVWIEVAAKLGAPVLRVFAGQEEKNADREEVGKWMAEDLRTCAEYGRRFGVMVGLQHHGDFLKTAEQTLRIVEMANSSWLGVVVDTGNLPKDTYNEIAALMRQAVSFQIKEHPLGEESPVRFDLVRFAKIVRDAGYRRYLPVETFPARGVKYEPLKSVPRFHAEVKAAFAQT